MYSRPRKPRPSREHRAAIQRQPCIDGLMLLRVNLMFKFLASTVGILSLIGLLVVIGLLALIF